MKWGKGLVTFCELSLTGVPSSMQFIYTTVSPHFALLWQKKFNFSVYHNPKNDVV